MRRILLIIEYMGTAYRGFQSQDGGGTVQDELEAALLRLTGQTIRVTAAGRTDAGVHALAMPVHFDIDKDYPAEELQRALNNYLPEDIRVKSAEQKSEEFHARFDAVRKTYLYKCYLSRIPSPLRRLTHMQVYHKIHLEPMREAAAELLGEHDFASFCAQGSDVHTTVRRIDSITITQSGDELYFEVSGNGFLRNMVRIIVALLLNVGRGRLTPSDVSRVIAERSRQSTRDVAPACGLYLKSVQY